MNRSSRRSLAIAAVVLAVLVLLPTVASANHQWGNYHWGRSSNPFTVKLGDNVGSAWNSYLATTSSDWSLSSVLDTVIVDGGTNPRRCRPTLGRVEVCNSTYGNTGWLGVASIWASGSHITQGTVKVNDTYFNSSTYNTPAWRNLVMCQEVGHTFGLDHQDENFNNPPLGTCMDYSSNPEPNQHPNAHDYEELEIIYAHLDDVNTAFSTLAPSAWSELNPEGPGQWGHLVSISDDGRQSVHELDFGGGFKIITHVLWAIDIRPYYQSRHIVPRR